MKLSGITAEAILKAYNENNTDFMGVDEESKSLARCIFIKLEVTTEKALSAELIAFLIYQVGEYGDLTHCKYYKHATIAKKMNNTEATMCYIKEPWFLIKVIILMGIYDWSQETALCMVILDAI